MLYIHLFICKIGSLHNVWSAAVKAESKSQPPLLCMEIKTQAESLNALSPRHKSQPSRNLLTTSTLTRKSLRWKADIFFCNLIFIPLHKVLFFFSFSLTHFFFSVHDSVVQRHQNSASRTFRTPEVPQRQRADSSISISTMVVVISMI